MLGAHLKVTGVSQKKKTDFQKKADLHIFKKPPCCLLFRLIGQV